MKRVVALVFLAAVAGVLADSSFSGGTKLVRSWTYRKTGATPVSEVFDQTAWTATHTSGTNASQMSAVWERSLTLTGGSTNLLNVAGGLTNSFGDALTLSRVNLCMFSADVDNTDTVVIGGASSNALATIFGDTADTLVLRPGGFVLLSAPDATGYTTDAGTNAVLQLVNTGTNNAVVVVTIGGAE